jgi:hypothetical protein
MTMIHPASCMEVRAPLDQAVIASALMGRVLRVSVVEHLTRQDFHG